MTAKLLVASRDRTLPLETRQRLRATADSIRAAGFPSPCDACTRLRLWAQTPKVG